MDFKFFRVWINDKIERVLVSVTDTTESVMLQASLEAQKEQENREMEMLSTIFEYQSCVAEQLYRQQYAKLGRNQPNFEITRFRFA